MQRIDHKLFFLLSLAVISTATLELSGCGGGSTESTEQAPVAGVPQQSTQSETSAGTQGSPAVATPAAAVDPNRKETKWIGKIPYDVFYDQPLTVAADATLIGGVPAGASVATNSYPEPAMAENKVPETPVATEGASSKGSVDWASILPMPMLQNELKTIRTRLTANLQSVGNYNRTAQEIALDGAIVAGLGAITTVHPEADSWKDRGKFIRDLGYAIYSASGESGRTAYKATEEPFLKLQTAMDGGTVDGLESEEVVPFGDVIYVADMMKRLETTFNNLKANINTEARMKEDPESVMRDLHMLATFGTLMGTESYDNTDAKKYQEFVAAFVGGAMKGVDAVKTENFDGFRAGLNEIQTTCSECHQQYRGSDSGF